MKKGETSQNRNFRKPSFSKATLVPLKFEVGKILWNEERYRKRDKRSSNFRSSFWYVFYSAKTIVK
jgi:hypothetical protein